MNKLPFAVPYPPLNTEEASPDTVTKDDVTADGNMAPVTPKYMITHRGRVELQDYTTDRSYTIVHIYTCTNFCLKFCKCRVTALLE